MPHTQQSWGPSPRAWTLERAWFTTSIGATFLLSRTLSTPRFWTFLNHRPDVQGFRMGPAADSAHLVAIRGLSKSSGSFHSMSILKSGIVTHTDLFTFNIFQYFSKMLLFVASFIATSDISIYFSLFSNILKYLSWFQSRCQGWGR